MFTTTDSEEVAMNLVNGLLEKRLAACVWRLRIGSKYLWKGGVEEAKEILIIAKTAEEKIQSAFEFLRENHNYEVPEVIALEPEYVDPGYAKWLVEELKTAK